MAGFRLKSDKGGKLKYVDIDTGKPVEIRSLIDPDNGRKITVAVYDGALHILQIHGDSMKGTMWKKILKVREDVTDPSALSKKCNATEIARIKSVTNVEAIAIKR